MTPKFCQRASGHLLYRHSQKAPYPFALVPSCFGPTVLLARICDQEPHWNCVCGDELRCPRHHVLLLLSDGRQAQAKVVQQHVHHCRTDLANGRGCDDDCSQSCPPTLVWEGMSCQAGEQYSCDDHVRQLSDVVLRVLFQTILVWGG